MTALNAREGLLNIVLWLQKAFPEPTSKNVSTQLGVHIEEFGEMLEEISHEDHDTKVKILFVKQLVLELSILMKKNTGLIIRDRTRYLDAICDQLVTATGCAHMSNMDVIGALNEVNRSNFSKFDENGNPVFDENLKLIKSENYSPAQLELFANE